jgi:hypothetical protein
MPKITEASLAIAIAGVETMIACDVEKVCDELLRDQPTLLSSILVLPQMGCASNYVHAALNILLVAYIALKEVGTPIETISEAEQEKELRRYSETVKFSEGLEGSLIESSIEQYAGYQKEPWLMGYVVSVLQNIGINSDESENTKYIYMAAFTLVGCIANAKTSA